MYYLYSKIMLPVVSQAPLKTFFNLVCNQLSGPQEKQREKPPIALLYRVKNAEYYGQFRVVKSRHKSTHGTPTCFM